MDFYTHMNLVGSDLSVDTARWTREMHEAVRQAIEQHLEGAWRVTKIEGQSETSYAPTLVTHMAPTPEYILERVLVTFAIEAVENGPIDKTVGDNLVPVRLPLKRLFCDAQMLSTGKLRIMHCTYEAAS